MRELATFERESGGNDIDGTAATWGELFAEYVNLMPAMAFQQRREFAQATQITSQVTHVVEVHWSPTAAVVRPKDRFKIPLVELVDESDPIADENFRIFNIEVVTNQKETNRCIELLCIERL